jgi:hypothetical protein
MKRHRFRAVALVAVLALTGCGSAKTKEAEPGSKIDRETLTWEPCAPYSGKTLAAVMADAMRTAGWPRMKEAPPAQHRVAAHVKRCHYRYVAVKPELDGDQSLNVFIYYELNNGGPLMAACKQRETPDPERPRIGDESCREDSGQWRFRVAEQYVSVLIEVPARIVARGGHLRQVDTVTFVASDEPAALGELGLPVAMDLAARLR